MTKKPALTKDQIITEIFQYDLRWVSLHLTGRAAVIRKRYMMITICSVLLILGIYMLICGVGRLNKFTYVLMSYPLFELGMSIWVLSRILPKTYSKHDVNMHELSRSQLKNRLKEVKDECEKKKKFAARELGFSRYVVFCLVMVSFSLVFKKVPHAELLNIVYYKRIFLDQPVEIFTMFMMMISQLTLVFSGFKSPRKMEQLFYQEPKQVSFYYLSHISNSTLNPNFPS